MFSSRDRANEAIKDFVDENKEKLPKECLKNAFNYCSVTEYELDVPHLDWML